VRRRDLVKFIVGSTVVWPLAVRAEPVKMPTIGFVGTDATVWGPWTAAFVERLRELGWIKGRNVAIEYRWDQASHEQDAKIAAELVNQKVDVIVTVGSAVTALKQATSIIPIIFAVADDPVGRGLVADLARPGGNVTGLSLQEAETAGKRLELLHEIVPHLHRLGVMADGGNSQAMVEMSEVKAAARTLGFAVTVVEIQRPDDVETAFVSLDAKVDALYVVGDALVTASRSRIITYALTRRLPTMFNIREFVQAGGLISYGPNFPALFRRAAETADKILHGTRPGDIPVEQPTKFDLVINITTARALGLTVPQSLLATADEVIE